ncbi:MAG: queuosine salvage family protein [Desulfobacterales bacterium]|nr:MAG: queuosine salvage family protein [Desulfobacterales bacterium]
MKSNTIEDVRTACQVVAERAIHVRINYGLIPHFASSLAIQEAIYPELDPQSHYLDHGNDTVAFIVTLDSINFGSGYFPHLHKRPDMSGYFTVASSLNDYFKKHGPISANELRSMTIEDCAKIFNQDLNNRPVNDLMQLFATALNDLGRYLLENFNGSFVNLVESASSSADRLVQLLIKMPYFKDVESYDNLKVPFYKRAQLTAADLSLAFNGTGPGHFNDLDRLTIFADNLVPHVLRVDEILFYEKNLLNRIDAGNLIPTGSHEEIEIRACAVHAVELLKEELRKAGHFVTSLGLDFLLWNRGQQPHYKRIPRHRTRTVFY